MPGDRETQDLLILHRRTAGHPALLARLLRDFGNATTVRREATPALLTEMGLSPAAVATICDPIDRQWERRAEQEMRWLSSPCHHLVDQSNPCYPERLREIHDAPPLLFCDGNIELLTSIQVAMVGSRKMSATGRKVANMLAADLCRAGATVTSGLAKGIDAASHQGALSASGQTIAVLGTGCDRIYPAVNQRLARDIREQAGLIVSEFPLGTGPRDYHFPRRNRIVTGMSVGVVVVEAALRSGSLISARLAMEQGREVFAVPGSVLNPLTEGCHRLIRDGAKLTASVTDIVEELTGIVAVPGTGEDPLASLGDSARRMVALLGEEPKSIDSLVEACGLAVTDVLALLTDLEIDGLVTAAPGGYCLSSTCLHRLMGNGT